MSKSKMARQTFKAIKKYSLSILAYSFLIFVFAVIQYSRFGDQWDYRYLVGGSLIAGLGGFTSGLLITYRLFKWGRGFLGGLASALSFILIVPAFILSSYVFFVRGLWQLVQLFNAFSIVALLKALSFITIGGAMIDPIDKLVRLLRRL